MDSARFVLVEPNRNLLLGVAILVGFVTFVGMDKGLRIATGGEEHTHDHGTVEVVKPVASSSALDSPAKGTRSRKAQGANAKELVAVTEEKKEMSASVKLGGYLNLM